MGYAEETRREAYEQVEPRSIRMKITKLLTDKGPMTSSEIMAELNIQNPNTVRPRLTELKSDGVIKDVGKRVPRVKTNFFRSMTEAVWEIAV